MGGSKLPKKLRIIHSHSLRSHNSQCSQALPVLRISRDPPRQIRALGWTNPFIFYFFSPSFFFTAKNITFQIQPFVEIPLEITPDLSMESCGFSFPGRELPLRIYLHSLINPWQDTATFGPFYPIIPDLRMTHQNWQTGIAPWPTDFSTR